MNYMFNYIFSTNIVNKKSETDCHYFFESIINEKFLDYIHNEFGFSKPSTFPTSPDNTSIATIPTNKLLLIILKVPFYILEFYFKFFKSKFPQRLKNFIKSKIRSA